MRRLRWREWVPPGLVILGAFVLWEGLVTLLRIPVFILPGPTAVWTAYLKWQEAIWFNAAQTLYTTLVGFGLALAGGMGLGLAIGYSTLVYRALYPLLVAFNSIPKVAIVPVLVIWFGIGTIPAILTAFLISFFPIVVNVATGLATLEPELQDVLRSLGASKREIFLKIGIPRSLPYFFASLKVAATLAFVGAVISETVAANRGIGYLMIAASSRFEVPLVFAGLVVVAAMGVALFVLFAVIERQLTGWAYRGQAL
ncbi:MAG: ABC transporter permease [Armatimonadota bacterium]|nr:ABC transporter permease [Armatimonadota bacterium]MDR7426988.1 ABC transporter permease [Armatimonadota bacterium]MDR7463094.1 ABC transporter permease [Armatimonadota bacterium]MDR7469323.1 ABC transporter permease [Armatimonadota bacterium]MDR7475511.1 ABC transporter permease [Armatimonadota bacterium]